MNAKSKIALRKERLSLDRMNALSDGVIAIVITLMVLGIDIPTDHSFSEEGLLSFFKKLEPSMVAYASSFIMTSIYWVQSHILFSFLRFVNRRLILLNLLFLFPVTMLPFVAKVRALYRYDPLVVIIFSSTHILCGLLMLAIWFYMVSHPELLIKTPTPDVKRSMVLHILVPPLISFIALASAFVNIDFATYIFAIVPFFYFTNHHVDNFLSENA